MSKWHFRFEQMQNVNFDIFVELTICNLPTYTFQTFSSTHKKHSEQTRFNTLNIIIYYNLIVR